MIMGLLKKKRGNKLGKRRETGEDDEVGEREGLLKKKEKETHRKREQKQIICEFQGGLRLAGEESLYCQ